MPSKPISDHKPVTSGNIERMAKTPQPYTLADGKTRWRVYYRKTRADGSIGQTNQGFEDYESAERWAKLIDKIGIEEALKVLPSWQTDKPVTPDLRTFALEHIDLLTGVGEDYRRRSRRVIENDLGVLGELPIDAIGEDEIAKWIGRLADAGAAGKTIKNKHGLLSAVFKRAVRKKIISANPCEGSRIPKSVRTEMVILTPDEFRMFLTCFTPHWQPLVAFLFGSGLRFSEATALNVGDIDLEGKRVSVTKAWKNNGRTLGAPKTERSRRLVSISDETVEAIRPLVKGRAPGELLFKNQRGDKVRSQTFHDNAWDPAVRLANGEDAQKAGAKRVARRRDAQGNIIKPLDVPIRKRPRVHDARHSHASWLLGARVPINYVQAQLGHESIQTTVDRYGHLMPDAGLAISAALSGVMGEVREIEG